MPRMPKWLANTAEKIFDKHIHPVEVVDVEFLADSLKRVRFEGNLTSTKYNVGNVIEFRVNDTDFRHFTPSMFNAEKGICDVVFYLHGKGPGSNWAKVLERGQQTKLMGPGGKLAFNGTKTYHVIFGDETSLGLCQAIGYATQVQEVEYLCLLELAEDHRFWPDLVNISADVVIRNRNEEVTKTRIKRELDDLPAQFMENAEFYLTGNAKSIQWVRKCLLQNGVLSKQMQSQPYWAVGKKGL